MDAHTRKHLASLRQALVDRLAELCREVGESAEDRIAEAARFGDEVTDRKDLAGQRASAVVAQEAEQRDLAESAAVQEALRRMDEGSYGSCLDCGLPVGWKRLQALPAAARCAVCQEAQERTAGPARGGHRS